MLVEVRIENLAVIEELAVQFESGFTALTGETGAGKSLLVQALELVAGGRAATDAVRSGADQALVEARVRLVDAEAKRQLAEQGYGNGDTVVVRRLIQANGDHRVYVNGRMATVQLLADCIGPEVEIHAQHSQQRLLESQLQTELLDRYGELARDVDSVGQAWQAWETVRERRANLESQAENREREIDFLKFQLEEFERVAPKPGELAELEGMLSRAQGHETVVQAIRGCREWLADGEGSAIDRLFTSEDALREAAKYDDRLKGAVEQLRTLGDGLNAVIRELQAVDTGIDDEEVDPTRIEARVDELRKLVRKFGGDLDNALQEREQMVQTLAELEDHEAALAELAEQEQRAEAAYMDLAVDLSDKRRAAAESLSQRIESLLHQLEMPSARFAVGGWRSGKPTSRGVDRVEFQLAANPGDEPRAIRKVASGGELSRILLAVQSATGTEVDGATVVFDEVDTGIGGETATVVGTRMRGLGDRVQVLAVTHTPQVAANAHQHIRLEKAVLDGRAKTVARSLEGEARVDELARMLGSSDTASARSHAETLLSKGS